MSNVFHDLARDLVAEIETIERDSFCTAVCDCGASPDTECGYEERLLGLAEEMRRRLWVAEIEAGRSS